MMARMPLCGLTAAALSVLSLGVITARYHAVGDEIKSPAGPNTWKVTLTVHGHAEAGARVWTAAPLDFRRQHVLHEETRSAQFEARPVESKDPRRRSLAWTLLPGGTPGPFKLRCEFTCAIDVDEPSGSMTQLARTTGGAPPPGKYPEPEPRGSEQEQLASLACQLTAGHMRLRDQARALFDYVSQEIANEPSVAGEARPGPQECLAEGVGDAEAKARLLAALLRVHGIPTRLVAGVVLSRASQQPAHHWVESWIHDRWVPMCPFHHHFSRLPSTYLVFTLGDLPLVRARQVRDLEFGFLVERCKEGEPVAEDLSTPKRFFRSVSLYMLPPAEQRLVEFLLLLPPAALVVCVFRNVIGLITFGTFTPALLGLAFRERASWPGVGVFLLILLVGWLFRRVLDHYRLLQVPRIALMLSVVVALLVAIILAANHFAIPATRYVSLFPLVILTGMIERFWTLEAEDGTAASFRTLWNTLLVSATVAFVVGFPALGRHLVRYPETLGLVMAGQLLIGRYTGYRFTELFRYRDFVTPQPPSAGQLHVVTE